MVTGPCLVLGIKEAHEYLTIWHDVSSGCVMYASYRVDNIPNLLTVFFITNGHQMIKCLFATLEMIPFFSPQPMW